MLTGDLHDRIRQLREAGMTVAAIAAECGVCRNTVSRVLDPAQAAKHRAAARARSARLYREKTGCLDCGTPISYRAKRCASCAGKERFRPENVNVFKIARCAVPGTTNLITRVRFVAAVRAYMLREGYTTETKGWQLWLSARTGVGIRRLSVYFSPNPTEMQPEHMEFNTVDRVFCRLGLTHLWHVPPEAGGFADLYEDDYGKVAA